MAASSANPSLEEKASGTGPPARQTPGVASILEGAPKGGPSGSATLKDLLELAALHEQVRRRRAHALRHSGLGAVVPAAQPEEQFVLEEVMSLVARHAAAITSADGVAIALSQGHDIVMCAKAGAMGPDIGECIDRDSAFSAACFRMGQAVSCDDSETDQRVNQQACRLLGARSLVAVPLRVRGRVVGVLEAFSKHVSAFRVSDISTLSVMAELVVGAMNPEDEDRFSEFAQLAAAKLAPVPRLAIVSSAKGSEQHKAPAFLAARKQAAKLLGAVRHHAFLLVSIVVAAAFVAGVWLRTARVGGAPLRTARAAARQETTIVPTMAGAASPPGLAGHDVNSSNDSPALLPDAGSAAPARPALQRLLQSPRVTSIQYSSTKASTEVAVDIDDEVPYEAHRLTDPDRIYLDLQGTQLTPELAGKSIHVGDALLKRIRVAQPLTGVTRIVLETKVHSTSSVRLEKKPCRIVIELSKAADP